MDFEWDEAKAASNLEKHGVSFEVVFELAWDDAVAEVDSRRDYGEVRLRTMLMGPAGRYVVVFTPRHGRHRIISVRRAHLKEYRRWVGQ